MNSRAVAGLTVLGVVLLIGGAAWFLAPRPSGGGGILLGGTGFLLVCLSQAARALSRRA
jgi:hypothetical protein